MAITEEHPDSDRFARECELWYGIPIEMTPMKSAADVWMRRRYMSGIHGASCTSEVKINERMWINKELNPAYQVFGFTAGEERRAERMLERGVDVPILTPLINKRYSKTDCHAAVQEVGIALPVMYRLGFSNNNCVGCVKASGLTYWRMVREHFPHVFKDRASLSRSIGCRLLRVRGTRYFLDEIDEICASREVCDDRRENRGNVSGLFMWAWSRSDPSVS